MNLFVHKIEKRDQELKNQPSQGENKNDSNSRPISTSPKNSASNRSQKLDAPISTPDPISGPNTSTNANNLQVNITAPVNVLSSIDSDDSIDDKTSKQINDLSSNQNNENDNTDINKSINAKEASIVLSDLGISINEEESQALKSKL